MQRPRVKYNRVAAGGRHGYNAALVATDGCCASSATTFDKAPQMRMVDCTNTHRFNRFKRYIPWKKRMNSHEVKGLVYFSRTQSAHGQMKGQAIRTERLLNMPAACNAWPTSFIRLCGR
jgi:hypothetical protein